jgi:hypothetical protein
MERVLYLHARLRSWQSYQIDVEGLAAAEKGAPSPPAEPT